MIVHCILGGENEEMLNGSLTTMSCDVCEQSGDFMPPVSGERKFQVPDSNYK